MKKDISSEEKLLNLIRKKNPADKKEKAVKPPKNAPAWIPSTAKGFPDFTTTTFRFLLVICLGLVFYIGSHIFLFKPAGDNFLSLEAAKVEDEKESASALETAPPLKPFSEYAQAFNERDLFLSALQRAQTQAIAAPPEAAVAPPGFDLSQNFRLVGIIVDNDPRAVVEDVRNQRTLFLSYGDNIEGAILKEIRDGKVIFTLNDRQIELVP
jgi:hypothetical protein